MTSVTLGTNKTTRSYTNRCTDQSEHDPIILAYTPPASLEIIITTVFRRTRRPYIKLICYTHESIKTDDGNSNECTLQKRRHATGPSKVSIGWAALWDRIGEEEISPNLQESIAWMSKHLNDILGLVNVSEAYQLDNLVNSVSSFLKWTFTNVAWSFLEDNETARACYPLKTFLLLRFD